MRGTPLVTIYIPCRNYGRYLATAIESVLSQLYRNWEMIIVDEASDDNTPAVSDYFHHRHPDRIKVVRNAAPVGL